MLIIVTTTDQNKFFFLWFLKMHYVGKYWFGLEMESRIIIILKWKISGLSTNDSRELSTVMKQTSKGRKREMICSLGLKWMRRFTNSHIFAFIQSFLGASVNLMDFSLSEIIPFEAQLHFVSYWKANSWMMNELKLPIFFFIWLFHQFNNLSATLKKIFPTHRI